MASLIGTEIGKYRITERIGRGGMAEVYEGIHTHLQRKVAIKVLHSHLLEGGDFIARFKREARAVANLQHPNIVQVHDFDIQDDLIFMVMQYIDGMNLHAKLIEAGKSGERLPITLIASIINDIASALDYAHAKGMLHRDIKPSNILIDNENKAYLADFGIAKLFDEKKFTATGQIIGTPAYMSPEQARGEKLTEESDIYSLGVVSFEMLTGQVPYDAETPIGIALKQINDPVPTMSELADDIPGTTQHVIDKALSKEPDSRYSTAEDLVGALKIAMQALEALNVVPVSIPEDPPTVVDDGLDAPTVTMDSEDLEGDTVVMEAEAKKEIPSGMELKKRNAPKPKEGKKKIPLWAYIFGGVALLAVAGVILTQVFNRDLIGEAKDIISTTIEVSAHASEGNDGLTLEPGGDGDFEDVTIGGLAAWQTGSGQYLHAADWNTDPDFSINFRIDDKIMNRLPAGCEVYIDVELLDAGTDIVFIEYDSHFASSSPNKNFRATDLHTKTNTGDFTIIRFTLNDPFFGNLTNGGDFRINDNSDGKEVIRSVKVIYFPDGAPEPALEPANTTVPKLTESTETGEELFQQGVEHFDAGQYEDCIELCYQAIDAGYDYALVYNQIGRSYLDLGEFESAIEPLDIAIELDPSFPWAFWTRGTVRHELGDFEGAIEDLTIGHNLEPDAYQFLHSLGNAHYESGSFDEALEYFDKALELDSDNPYSRTDRAKIRWREFGDVEGALQDFTVAIANAVEGYSSPFRNRGMLYLELGQYDLCVPDLDEALTINPENPWDYIVRGDCFNGLGDFDAARNDYEIFLELIPQDPEFEYNINRAQTWLDSH